MLDNSRFTKWTFDAGVALLISGPRVRVPGGAPYKRRKIERFCVFSFCKKGAAHILHMVCTFPQKEGLPVHPLHSPLSPAQKEIFQANKTRTNSLRSSAPICRMASRIMGPVMFVASGFLFCSWLFVAAPDISCL